MQLESAIRQKVPIYIKDHEIRFVKTFEDERVLLLDHIKI